MQLLVFAHTEEAFRNTQTHEESFAIPLEPSVGVLGMAVPMSACTFTQDFTHSRLPPLSLPGEERMNQH